MASTKRSRNLTPEQQAKSDARRAQFKALAQQIGSMTEIQQVQLASSMVTTLTVEGRALSLHNACLLACQCPHATLVGGFQQWIKAGRVVRKGEHGLMIWAPAKRAEDPNRRPGEMSSRDDRPGFIMVTVFDVSQTDAISQAVAS